MKLERLLQEFDENITILSTGSSRALSVFIEWVHILRSAGVDSVRPNELVLIRGADLPRKPIRCTEILSRLRTSGALALGIVEIEPDGSGITSHLVSEARDLELPMFVLHANVDPTQFARIAIQDFDSLGYQAAVSLQSKLLNLALHGDRHNLASVLIDRIQGAAVAVVRGSGHELVRVGEMSRVVRQVLGQYGADQSPRSQPEQPTLGEGFVASTRIELADKTVVTCILHTPEMLTLAQKLFFEQFVLAITVTVQTETAIRGSRQRLAARILSEGDEHHSSSRSLEALIESAAPNPQDPSAPYFAVVVRFPENNLLADYLQIVEDMLKSTNTPGVVTHNDGDLVCVVKSSSRLLVELIERDLSVRGGDVVVGVSLPRSGPGQCLQIIREAKAAAHTLSAGSGVVRSFSNGDGLLSALIASSSPDEFLGRLWGPVLELDEDERYRLIASVRAYVEAGCRSGPAAAQLFIHRHTLAYRLDRVRELTGRDPRDGANLIDFALGVEIHLAHRASAQIEDPL